MRFFSSNRREPVSFRRVPHLGERGVFAYIPKNFVVYWIYKPCAAARKAGPRFFILRRKAGSDMYAAGDWVVYGTTGVCRVEAVGAPPFASDRLYYTLHPRQGSETIYAPVDGPAFIRPVLTRQEALALIDQIPQVCTLSTEGQAQRQLADLYRSVLGSHSCEELVQLIKTVYGKARAGKVDQEFRRRAEGLLHQELSVALGIPAEQVPDFITRRIETGGGPA